MPYVSLGTNRFALEDGDLIFDTNPPKGKGPAKTYSLDGSVGSSTCGCSCEQILAFSSDNMRGHYKFGCSISVMDDFVNSRCQIDNDKDGYRISDGDCDDNNPRINPSATEVCDNVDNDCDGEVDEEACPHPYITPWNTTIQYYYWGYGNYFDADGDLENQSTYKWYVNDVVVESGIVNQLMLLHFDGTNKTTDLEAPIDYASGTYVTGKYGKALNISTDGKLKYTPQGNVENGNGTIEFWVKLNYNMDDATASMWFLNYWITAYKDQIQLYVHTNDYIYYTIEGNNNVQYVLSNTGTSWQAGEWHQIAITWEGKGVGASVAKMYLDGVMQTDVESDCTVPNGTATNFYIGSANGVAAFCDCVIDEFRIMNKPLSAEQIKADYDANRTFYQNEQFLNISNYNGGDSLTFEYTPTNNNGVGTSVNSSTLTLINCPKDNTYINEDTTLGGLECNVDDEDDNGVLIINASNIVLDCNNTFLNGNDNADSIAIYNNGYDNITIKNCNISNYGTGILFKDSVGHDIYNNTINSINKSGTYDGGGIFLTGVNSSKIYNNIASECLDGFFLYHSWFNNLTGLTSFNNTDDGILFASSDNNVIDNCDTYNNRYGIQLNWGQNLGEGNNNIVRNCYSHDNTNVNIYLVQVSGSTIENNNVSSSINGIRLYKATSNILRDNTFSSHTSSIYLDTGSDNNNITDSTLTDIYGIRFIASTGNNLINSFATGTVPLFSNRGANNSLINSTYGSGRYFGDSSSYIYVKWYLDVHVNYSNGTDVDSANVYGYDVNNNLAFSTLTDSNGDIDTQIVTEYYANASVAGSGENTYLTNYTINATDGTYTDEESVNLTQSKSIILTFQVDS